MQESYIERKLVEGIRALDGWCLKMNSTSQNGLPDRIILLPDGRTIFAELKASGKKPTTLQRFVHRRLMAMNFPVYVIDSLKGVEELVSYAKQIAGKGGDAV